MGETLSNYKGFSPFFLDGVNPPDYRVPHVCSVSLRRNGKGLKTMKPKIELKSVQVHLGLSEETPAYTAKLFVDGTHFADVSNDGHGGGDYVYPPKSEGNGAIHFNDDRLADLEKRIGDTYPEHECNGMTFKESLECVCHGLVWLHVDQKRFRGDLSRKVLMLDGGKMYHWKKNGRTTEAVVMLVQKKHPDATILNALPFQEAWDAVVALEAGGSG